MSYDQKPARMRVVDGTTGAAARRETGQPLSGGFAAGPAPRRKAAPGTRAIRPRLGRMAISILFLSAALIGGVVQAYLLLRA